MDHVFIIDDQPVKTNVEFQRNGTTIIIKIESDNVMSQFGFTEVLAYVSSQIVRLLVQTEGKQYAKHTNN